MAIVALNENYQLGLDYQKVFHEPLASNVKEWILDKKYTTAEINELIATDEMEDILQPDYLDLENEGTQVITRKMKELSLTDGWEPDTLNNYYLMHGRHDKAVPIQAARCIIPWMKEKGFRPSLLPGKTSLQTNYITIGLDHHAMAAVWFVQTAAAIQLWPVLYYEGEQNRYYRAVVQNLNLLRVVQLLEALGIDLRKAEGGESTGNTDIFETLAKFSDTLDKANLTIGDLLEMLDDSGITIVDILEVIAYLNTPQATEPAEARTAVTVADSPAALLRLYEKTLAAWLLMGGINVEYDRWAW
jgi:hypothetical protein